MYGARLRFLSLWVSQEARILAEWALRITAWLELARSSEAASNSAWHLTTALYILPFIVLAPLHGAICNALPRRWVLVAGALLALIGLAVFLPTGGPWIAALAVSAVGAALYSPTRFAMLPAVAQDTRWPLPRINGWIEMGVAGGIVGGILLGLEPWSETIPGVPTVVGLIALLSLVCFLTTIPAHFPSDFSRPESPLEALRGFFRDCRRVLSDRPSCASLLSLAIFQGLTTAGSGAIVAHTIGESLQANGQTLHALMVVIAGVSVGCLAASLQPHPRRILGLVPLGVTGLLLAELLLAAEFAVSRDAPLWPCFLLGFAGGLVNVPLRSAYLAAVPADARGNATSVMNFTIYFMMTLISAGMYALTATGLLPSAVAQLLFLAVLAGLAALLAWRYLFIHLIEQGLEILFWFPYRMRGHGPGLHKMPTRGPLILVGNHTSYFDPFWIGKFIPRHYCPMMTSKFYDLPVVRWLMVHVVGTIRVEVGKYRREAPELKQAIEVLRRGGCVLIYPEAILKRTEETYLRQFGQGIWHILRELPDTPVVVFWVEGGWGSYASYRDGPPFKNKRMDWRRPIDIAIQEPEVLSADVLSHHRRTRQYLMERCLDARRHLGLPVPKLREEAQDDGDAETASSASGAEMP